MRVLMLNYEFPPLGGGAAQANRNILRAMAGQAGLEIDLITSCVGEGRQEKIAPGQTIHFVDIGKHGGLHYQTNRDLLIYTLRAYRCARALTKQHRYDLCHAFFGIPCGVMAWRLGLPYIVSLRGSDVPYYNARFRMLDTILFKRLSAHVWSRASSVVANSEGLRDLALKSAPGQIIDVIPNGVDTTTFRPGEPLDPNGGLRTLTVARLIQRKGIEHLIDAMAQLGDDRATLTIVGEGNQREALAARAADLGDRVRFLGAVPHEQLPSVYRTHDVFVLPSLNEGMSNTVLEAMASGLPILMTRTGGARELIEPGVNGDFIEPDGADIARALNAYLQRPALIRSHGAHSRAKAEARGWDDVAAAYLAHYRAAVGSGA